MSNYQKGISIAIIGTFGLFANILSGGLWSFLDLYPTLWLGLNYNTQKIGEA